MNNLGRRLCELQIDQKICIYVKLFKQIFPNELFAFFATFAIQNRYISNDFPSLVKCLQRITMRKKQRKLK